MFFVIFFGYSRFDQESSQSFASLIIRKLSNMRWVANGGIEMWETKKNPQMITNING